MIDDGYDQQMQYQAQQTFRADDASLATDVETEHIFLKNELPWRFDSRTKLNHLVVSNNVLILHINEKTLQRRCSDDVSKDPKASSAFQEVQMSEAINKVFLDPFGRLVIVSTRDKREVYILVSSANSLKLNKKNIRFPNPTSFVLASVSWCNRFLQQNDTIALLAGQDGSIFELSIRSDGEWTISTEVYPSFKNIMNDSRDELTGIYCDVKSSYEDNSNIFIVITTKKALYYFEHQIDPSRKSDYFASFFAIVRDASLPDLKYREFPVGNSQSEIQLFVKRKSNSTQLLTRQFAWITAAGLYYTEIDPTDVQKSFLERSHIIDYYINKSLKQRDEEKPPKSVALTEFHCLMMFPNENQIRAVCTVNEKLVMKDDAMGYGKPVCYARDQIRDQIWQCTEERVLRYTIKDERRDVWRVFMQKKDFIKALETCTVADDPIETKRRQRSINSKNADYLFNEKKYSLSASIYANSDTSFEDVTLKFLAFKDKEPLREYLQSVLKFQKPTTDSTQITILTLWLTDLFLNDLDELREIDSSITNPARSPTNRSLPMNQPLNEEILDEKTRKEKFEKIRRNFHYFLQKTEIQSCLKEHRSAMYDLLTSHGALDDLIFFAVHVQDNERVILIYLEREDYKKALETLEPLNDNQLLYKYSPTLIEKLPDTVINLWKKKNKEYFEPKELLPAMIAYSRAYPKGKAVLEFLRFCVQKGCIDKSIHNYLLSEYIKFDPGQIMKYLKDQKEDLDGITYDPRYALRLCIDNDLKEESVFLYRILNMYEEAVETALQVSVKLAEESARAVPSNDERTKKLWLKIAGSAVTQGRDLNEVMKILEDCGNDLLKIEDVLPLFPDFETIDQFKKPIIKSLENYNERLNDLRTEMEDASKSIGDIRSDLAKYRTRCVATIDSTQTCSLCEQALMLQSTFYIFACGHYFHGDCLFTYVRRLMKRKDESTITDKTPSPSVSKVGQGNDKIGTKTVTQTDIDTVNRLQSIIASGIAPPSRDMESVQQELDDIVASQCVLCGETAVDYLDQPLDAFL